LKFLSKEVSGMISSLVTVPRGAAQQRPKKDVLDAAEMDQLRQNATEQDVEGMNASDDEDEGESADDEDAEVRAAVRLAPAHCSTCYM
jgi:hypothetical protein